MPEVSLLVTCSSPLDMAESVPDDIKADVVREIRAYLEELVEQ